MDDTDTPAFQQELSAQSSKAAELEAWRLIANALGTLDAAAQGRVLKSVSTLLEIDVGEAVSRNKPSSAQDRNHSEQDKSSAFSLSEERNLSPKEFLHQKRPPTDVDRVACLAYYLTHYRSTPHFKTIDLSQLNTEAAQIKFSNAAKAVDNATRSGLLVPAVKGHKQLSAAGELYVQELPDKAAAKSIIEGYKRRRPKKGHGGSRQSPNQD